MLCVYGIIDSMFKCFVDVSVSVRKKLFFILEVFGEYVGYVCG